MAILEIKDIGSYEAMDLLEKGNVEENQTQKRTLEFLRKNLHVKDKGTIEKIREDLKKLRELKEHQIDKLLEIFPKHKEIVEAIFYKERLILSKEEVEKISNLFKSIK